MENQEVTPTAALENERLLMERFDSLVRPLGYEIIAVETQIGRDAKLRVFIDRTPATTDLGPIGIQDCVTVTRALEEPTDQLPEIAAIFKGHYEMEVSSPGAERPLQRFQDYSKFVGEQARIHVLRPLTDDEIENANYREKNPKQKNFIGILRGVAGEKVRMEIAKNEVCIPLPLVAKAHLEPSAESWKKTLNREKR